MAADNSSAPQKSPPNSSLPPNTSTPSPPPEKSSPSSPSPPPPSKSSPSPPPPQKVPPPSPPSNNGSKNGGGKFSPSPPSTPNQSSSDENETPESQPPPDSSNNSPSENEQSEAPPEEQASPETPSPQSPPPPPTGDKVTPSSSTSENVPVPPGRTNSPTTTVIPTRSSPKQPSNNSLPNGSESSSSSEGPPSLTSPSSLHKAMIVGAVAGTLVVFVVMIICLLCMKRKKKKSDDGLSPYGGWELGLGPPGNQYWKASPQDYATMKIIPTPGSGYERPSSHKGGSNKNFNESGQHSGPPMSPSLTPSPGLALGFNKSAFSYDELAIATNGFHKANILGQGGFGFVHKGVFPNGKEIAVKRLKSGSGQGEREFQAEVEIISRVHHRHLVSLVGYCIADGQRMLVYEFVSNYTLEYHLHEKADPTLDFPTRLRIALGSAKGLSYLHEDCHPRIIHRDIKASNILLDDNFEAMVADFGLAKLTDDANTHVSTRVMGTFGYLAPEYASSGKLTEKSDVFSFGVMLLELITGRRPVDPDMRYMEDCLVDWARPLLTKAGDTNSYDELADPRLEMHYNPHEMQRMVACAAASIRHSAKKRPKMSQIVRVLEGDVSLEDLNEGVKPGQSSIHASSDGSDYDTRQYSADLKRFRQMAFEPRNFASTEYGATTTSEYGLNPSGTSSDSSREMK